MTEHDVWNPVRSEFDRWAHDGLTARLWLRDDDAIAATPALARLLASCRAGGVTVLIAAIPMAADASLQRALAGATCAEVAVHGIWHRNHAPPTRKAEELAPERGRSEIMAALVPARARLQQMLGADAGRWYVPPWNRITPEVASWLPEAGFSAVSTFGTDHLSKNAALLEANTHVDIIDWKGGRVGRPVAWVAAELARQLALARADGGRVAGGPGAPSVVRPIGILTHHLVHDDSAWAALDGLLAATRHSRGARWIRPSELLVRPAAAP